MLEFRGIGKRFPGVQALHQINLRVRQGSCHALLGENGAGKSTLGRVLAGIAIPDEGDIRIDGKAVRFRSPRDARLAGIGMVHQELAFCENLTVAENLGLGGLPHRGPFVRLDLLKEQAGAALRQIEVDLPLDGLMAELSVGHRQLAQIAAAVSGGARILVFDEPTSSLSHVETRHLFSLIRRLSERGVTSLYISHRLEEIFELCDTVTVLRDGRVVDTLPLAGLGRDDLVRMMIGRPLDATSPRLAGAGTGTERLAVTHWSSPGKFQDVSLSVRAGEIVGLAGLVGSGRTEILRSLFGLDPRVHGALRLDGKSVRIADPGEAMRHGIGFVPEDRKTMGLIPGMKIRENISLPILDSLARAGWVRRGRETALARDYVSRLGVRPADIEAMAASLSGGNQQKVVMAKWLAAKSRLLMLDEPTRGVDVGAKAEIHALIRNLARTEGRAILFVSSELPEVLSLADRIVVIRHGRLAGEFPHHEADQESLLRCMAGV